MANTVKTPDGIEVYASSVHQCADEYINDLQSSEGYTDDEIKSLLRKPPIFRGMLKYIYINCFKITDKDIKYSDKNSRLDYSNIDLINGIWDIYTRLCYKYLQNPSILNFSIMTGITTDTIDRWNKGTSRGCIYYDSDNNVINNLPAWKLAHPGGKYREEPSSKRSDSVKKWLAETEAALFDGAATGNPGCMFLLKSNYGYAEAPQQIEIKGGQLPTRTAAEIAAGRNLAELPEPEKPEL